MSQAQVQGENSVSLLKYENEMLIALGSNLTSSIGAPLETLKRSVEALVNHGASIRAMSAFYHTPSFPVGNGPDYVNAAVRIDAPWSPKQALEVCHAIEQTMERVRGVRWGQRTLDLDLIAAGDIVMPNREVHALWRDLPLAAQMAQTPDTLVLPHPRMQERAFVLVPLLDVAPEWVHPILGQSVTQMHAALDPALKEEVRALNNGL